jgi:hypothetical protein
MRSDGDFVKSAEDSGLGRAQIHFGGSKLVLKLTKLF